MPGKCPPSTTGAMDGASSPQPPITKWEVSAGIVSTRWIILACTCGALFGQFYAFDAPAVLNEQLKELLMKPTGITEEGYDYYFSLLYSLYSAPNVVLPLAMGLAVDRCGYRSLTILLSSLVVGGQLTFALGVQATRWSPMLLGRVIFGLGGESLQVAQNALLFRWFKGGELAFALGLNLSVARAGSVLNDIISPWLAARFGVQAALWLGTLLVCVGFACSAASVLVDTAAAREAAQPEPDRSGDAFRLSDLFSLPKSYWLLVALCVTIYCAILPFNNIASAFFTETAFADLPLADAQLRAGHAMAVLFLASALCTPPFGALVDRVGLRAQFLLASCVLLTGCYALIYQLGPMTSMLGLGVVYTIFAGALWPSIAMTVQQEQLGRAYGVAVSLQNVGLATVPLLVGYLQATSGRGHFEPIIRFFVFLGVIGVALSATLAREDTKIHGVLGLPSGEAEKRRAAGERKRFEAQEESSVVAPAGRGSP